MSDQNPNPRIENEVSLKEIFDFFAESWKLIMMSSLIVGTLGAGYVLMTPLRYQATANIQMAKLAGTDVEAPAILLEKLKIPSYYTKEILTACRVTESSDPGSTLVNRLKPTLLKNAPIISITNTDESAEIAKKCLEILFNDIRINQNMLANSMLQNKKNQLNILKQKLESAEKDHKLLSAKNPSFDFSDSKFSASTLLLATILSRENEVNDLRTRISDLETSLTEPQTRETFLTSPIHAPNTPVAPNKRLIILLGLIAGGVLAIVYLLLRKALR